jgi:CRP-like cAMP-binding protein
MFDKLRTHILGFVDMSEEEFNRGTTLLIPKKLRKRQYLLQAGDVCKRAAFVSRGCLRLYSLDDTGRERILNLAIEGSWLVDVESFQHQEPAASNIDALEDSELLLIDNATIEKARLISPKWDLYYMAVLRKDLEVAAGRIADFVGASAEERYLSFLSKYPDLFQRIPLHQIASYLGVTPQTLSRIRKQLSKRT